MRKGISLIITVLLIASAYTQTTAIPDVNFEQALINLGYDTGSPNGSVFTANINSVSSLIIPNNSNVSDLTGIEDFTALVSLTCNHNILTSLNLSQNIFLDTLILRFNQITNLNISQNNTLRWLDCYHNQLASLNVTQNTNLIHLNCEWNLLTNIDVTQNINLKNLACGNNQLSNVNILQNANIESLSITYNQLSNIDLTNNTVLNFLVCDYNQINSLDVTDNPLLWSLSCGNNQISELNLIENIALTDFSCNNNLLTCLSLKNGNNSNFTYFSATNNPYLTCIEVDNPTWSSINWTLIDVGASFSNNCNNVCSLVGFEENQLEQSINLYPNPVKEIVMFRFETIMKEVIVQINNIHGQTFLKQRFDYTDNIDLDIEHFNSGFYFARIATGNRVKTIKFIKK